MSNRYFPAGRRTAALSGGTMLPNGALGQPRSWRTSIPDWLSFRELPLTLSFVGLLFYTFVSISYKLGLADVAISLAIVGLILERHVSVPRPLFWFGAFLAWAAIGSVQSYAPSESLNSLWVLVKLLFVMWVTANAIQRRSQLQWFLLWFSATFGFFAMGMSLFFYARGIRHAGRLVGYFTYSNSNDLAAMCLVGLGVSLGIAAASPRNILVRWSAGIAAMGYVLAIVLSQSRAAMLALFLVVAPFVALQLMRSVRVWIYAAAAVTVLVVVAPDSAWERFSRLRNIDTSGDMSNVDAEGSAEERWALAMRAIEITKDHMAFGVGFGSWGAALARYDSQLASRDTHNTYLNVSAETGVVGLALYLACLGSVLTLAVKSVRFLKRRSTVDPEAAQRAALIRWMTIGLGAYFIASFFGTNHRLAMPYLIMGALCAACIVETRAATPLKSMRGRMRVADK